MRVMVASSHRATRQTNLVRHAANVVTFELLRSMAACSDVEVGYLHVALDQVSEGNVEEVRAELAAVGVAVIDPLSIHAPSAHQGPLQKVRRLVAPRLSDFYPIAAARADANRAVDRWRADAVLIPWSENLTALFADAPAVRYAYYGNPDPKPYAASLELRRRFLPATTGRLPAPLTALLDYVRLCRLERFHLDILRQYERVGDVALNDVQYYRDHGLDAFYVRNLWTDPHGENVHEIKQQIELPEDRIIGSIGRVNATANSFGLHILGEEIVPAIRRRLGGHHFSVHVLGSGAALPPIDAALRANPEVVMRGFVDDIDAEIQRAKVFLVANNAGPYKVGHTRFLHAWSLGCCVVAHVDATLSMPEIAHGYNALLGRDPDEMAELASEAMADASLRNRIAQNGYRTFKELFQAPAVAEGIIRDLRKACKTRASASTRPHRKAA
jgi:glycosyltransferase involved in cell wall biosynthesis